MSPFPIPVTITPDLASFCVNAAAERRRNNSRALTYRRLTNDSIEPHELGVYGEAVVCTYFGLDPMACIMTDAPDAGVDVTAYGLKIAVKAKQGSWTDMMVPIYQCPLVADVAILVWPTATRTAWTLAGWIHADGLLVRSRLDTSLPVKARVVNWLNLNDMADL